MASGFPFLTNSWAKLRVAGYEGRFTPKAHMSVANFLPFHTGQNLSLPPFKAMTVNLETGSGKPRQSSQSAGLRQYEKSYEKSFDCQL